MNEERVHYHWRALFPNDVYPGAEVALQIISDEVRWLRLVAPLEAWFRSMREHEESRAQSEERA